MFLYITMKNIAIEIHIPQNLKEEPLFYNICKSFNLIPNIIEASLTTDVGWALMTIKGEESEIDKLFDYLGQKGISWKIKY